MNRKSSTLAAAVALALGLPFATPAFAQDATNTATTLDTVIVTGTRASDRTAIESSAPIDVISAETLAGSGTTELATALSRLLPSLNFPRPSLTDGTDAIRPAQLRGLSPDQTLVLVDGKRRHTSALLNVNGSQGRGSAAVDLNAIPMSAIDHIEVLRDGAAAQYGSDAIAGVINIVLKHGAKGGSVQAGYGQYSAGDGQHRDVSGDVGVDLGGAGWLRLAAEVNDAEATNRSGVDFRARSYGSDSSYGKVNNRFGDPESTNYKLAINGAVDLSDNAEFYLTAMASRRVSESAASYRVGGSGTAYASVYPDGFLPLIQTDSRDQSLVAGVRGTSDGGWRWDVSGNYGKNTIDFDVYNTINSTLVASGDTRTHFYAGQLQYQQALFNADLAKEFDWGLYSPVTVAFGTEYRREQYDIGAGEYGSYVSDTTGAGSQGFTGFSPDDAGSHSRHSYAGYAELDADLSAKLNASAAVRYENYSDFGDTVSGKLALRYAFTDRLALRATVSNGFRAPSLAQQYYSAVSSTLINGSYYQIRTLPTSSALAKLLGAKDLKAEKSLNYSLGLVAQPSDRVTLSLDLYQIEIKDRIVLSENVYGSNVADYLESLGVDGVAGFRYFTNAVDTRTRGADLVATWRLDAGPGTLDLSASANYNRTEITHIDETSAELAALGFQTIGRAEKGRITKGSPRDKYVLGADYRLGNWDFNANLTRYGEVTTYSSSKGSDGKYLDQTFGAEWITNLAVSYRHGGWTYTVGGDNVFDVYPDKVRRENWGNPTSADSGLYLYSSYSPFGFNGAYVYAKAGYKW